VSESGTLLPENLNKSKDASTEIIKELLGQSGGLSNQDRLTCCTELAHQVILSTHHVCIGRGDRRLLRRHEPQTGRCLGQEPSCQH